MQRIFVYFYMVVFPLHVLYVGRNDKKYAGALPLNIVD
jgi:hypothetical protein